MAKRNNAEPELPAKIDLLADYKLAIATLRDAGEKLESLRQLEASLRADADGVANTKEKLLSDSVTRGDEDEMVEELSRLRSRGELLERKLADVTGRLELAEAEASSVMGATLSGFSGLYRAFYAWNFERQKAKVASAMIPGTGQLILEQCTVLSKEMASVKALEVTADDPGGLSMQAGRLLESVSQVEGFAIPLWQPSAAISESASAGEVIGLPYEGRGMSARQIQEAFDRIRLDDPALNYMGACKRLKELHPELFTPAVDNTPELDQPFEWKAPMIGSTRTQ